jgi:hypothetical protein
MTYRLNGKENKSFDAKHYCHHNHGEYNRFCNKYSDTYDYFCPEHIPKLDPYYTYDVMVANHIENHVHFITDVIKQHLKNVESYVTIADKIDEIIRMYDFMCENKWYIQKHEKFGEAVLTKLLEFEKGYTDDIYFTEHFDINFYKQTLFPQTHK